MGKGASDQGYLKANSTRTVSQDGYANGCE
jgi:hypothetical protein